MKNFLTILLLAITYSSFSQSWEFEEKLINQGIQRRSKTQLEIKEFVNDWMKFKAEYGDYPTLPFNDRNEIEYTFINDYKLNKEIIFNRILEWAAINFGSLDAVLHYKNFESGKIILKGQFRIFYTVDYLGGFWGDQIKEKTSSSYCTQTYVFTIKDNKLKTQVVDIQVKVEDEGYWVSGVYYPPLTLNRHINYYYPISNFGKLNWKSHLNILEKIDLEILVQKSYLNIYIASYVDDYSF
ncbi:MAG: DUF4468 domain-containing protein [Bacteroidota bacterium]|nr:DUF4468 domain-containing protein [Bacteroidota bacterium]